MRSVLTPANGGIVKMRDFIDVSFSTSDHQEPYIVLVFHDGRIVEALRCMQIAAVADYCRQSGLAVISQDDRVRADLYQAGVHSHMPLMRAVNE